MRKLIFSAWVLIVMTPASFAQSKKIGVTDVKGNVYIAVGSGSAKAFAGMQFESNAFIQMEGNSAISLALVDNPGMHKTLTSTNPKYVIEAGNVVFEKSRSDIQKFFDLVISLFKKEDVTTASSRKGTGTEYPMLFPADGDILLDTSLTFSWIRRRPSVYYFLLSDHNEEGWLCSNDHLHDTTISLRNGSACTAVVISTRDTYDWTIVPFGQNVDHSYFISFTFADERKKDSVAEDLTNVKNSEFSGQPELLPLLIAACYEKHHMYTEADKILKKAINEYPKSFLIASATRRFLARISSQNQPPTDNP